MGGLLGAVFTFLNLKVHHLKVLPINNYIIIIVWGFCDIQNNQGRGRGYKPKAEADNAYQGFDYSGYHKNRI